MKTSLIGFHLTNIYCSYPKNHKTIKYLSCKTKSSDMFWARVKVIAYKLLPNISQQPTAGRMLKFITFSSEHALRRREKCSTPPLSQRMITFCIVLQKRSDKRGIYMLGKCRISIGIYSSESSVWCPFWSRQEKQIPVLVCSNRNRK